jgi:hypothetical protein
LIQFNPRNFNTIASFGPGATARDPSHCFLYEQSSQFFSKIAIGKPENKIVKPLKSFMNQRLSQSCKNCEGKGLLKKGDKVVKCQRCGGTGFR